MKYFINAFSFPCLRLEIFREEKRREEKRREEKRREEKRREEKRREESFSIFLNSVDRFMQIR